MRNDAKTLKQSFAQHGIVVKDIKRCRLNASYIYRILRGDYPLTITYAMRLSESLGIPLRELRPDIIEKIDAVEQDSSTVRQEADAKAPQSETHR